MDYRNAKPTFLGWIVILLLLYAWNKTKTGHEILFYGMALIVLFLFVGNANRILPVLFKPDKGEMS
jgi:hypothetical protein